MNAKAQLEETVVAPVPASRAGRGLSRKAAALTVLLVGLAIYLGNAGFPGLLDDADASHAVVAREILQRHGWTILYMNGIRYLMKAPRTTGPRR